MKRRARVKKLWRIEERTTGTGPFGSGVCDMHQYSMPTLGSGAAGGGGNPEPSRYNAFRHGWLFAFLSLKALDRWFPATKRRTMTRFVVREVHVKDRPDHCDYAHRPARGERLRVNAVYNKDAARVAHTLDIATLAPPRATPAPRRVGTRALRKVLATAVVAAAKGATP